MSYDSSPTESTLGEDEILLGEDDLSQLDVSLTEWSQTVPSPAGHDQAGASQGYPIQTWNDTEGPHSQWTPITGQHLSSSVVTAGFAFDSYFTHRGITPDGGDNWGLDFEADEPVDHNATAFEPQVNVGSPLTQSTPAQRNTNPATSQRRGGRTRGNLREEVREYAAATRARGACPYCRNHKIRCELLNNEQTCQACRRHRIPCMSFGEELKESIRQSHRLHLASNANRRHRNRPPMPRTITLIFHYTGSSPSPTIPTSFVCPSPIEVIGTDHNWDIPHSSSFDSSAFELDRTLLTAAEDAANWMRLHGREQQEASSNPGSQRNEMLVFTQTRAACQALLVILEKLRLHELVLPSDFDDRRARPAVTRSLLISVIMQLEECFKQLLADLLPHVSYVGPAYTSARNRTLLSSLALVQRAFETISKLYGDELQQMSFMTSAFARAALENIGPFARVMEASIRVRGHRPGSMQEYLYDALIDHEQFSVEVDYTLYEPAEHTTPMDDLFPPHPPGSGHMPRGSQSSLSFPAVSSNNTSGQYSSAPWSNAGQGGSQQFSHRHARSSGQPSDTEPTHRGRRSRGGGRGGIGRGGHRVSARGQVQRPR